MVGLLEVRIYCKYNEKIPFPPLFHEYDFKSHVPK